MSNNIGYEVKSLIYIFSTIKLQIENRLKVTKAVYLGSQSQCSVDFKRKLRQFKNNHYSW
jgi:hypothetical protein